MRLIKRYANRKLYDTSSSSYVTLQQIGQYVRAGEEVQILDNRTKQDVTHITLAQIVYDNEKRGGEDVDVGRTVGSLRGMIQDRSEKVLHSLQRTLDQRMRTWVANAVGPLEPLRAEVEQLKTRVAELEAQLESHRSSENGQISRTEGNHGQK